MYSSLAVVLIVLAAWFAVSVALAFGLAGLIRRNR